MADQPVPSPEGRPTEAPSDPFGWVWTLLRYYLMYSAFVYVSKNFLSQGNNTDTQSSNQHPQTVPTIKNFSPLWKFNQKLDLNIYFSEDFNFNVENADLKFAVNGFEYGNFSVLENLELQIPVSNNVQNNGTLFAHIFVFFSNELEPPYKSIFHSPEKAIYMRKLLTRFKPKRTIKKTKKLVMKDSDNQITEEEVKEVEDPSNPKKIVSYWWPNITICLVADEAGLSSKIQPFLLPHVRIAPSGKEMYPIFYYNDFWMLNDQLQPINDTVKSFNVSFSFYQIGMMKMQFYAQFTESFKVQNTMMGVESSETDEMKRMFLETNPYLLGVTIAVSLFHSLFDFLAFKNDIQFWSKKKDMEGLSLRSIVLNIVFQFVIFLYLLDNNTSWVILISSGVGLLIEMWKVQRTVIVSIDFSKGFPFVHFKDRVKLSKLSSITKKYDEIAFTYLSYGMMPLLIGYAIYSLVYEEHKSWYSYLVGTLVGFVYAFGFITMTPQLFINYKLKSVAHMPWKTFMYKALNTFVDDLFAFVVKMPMLHRLACLRDDVVFFVYLYQKWIYKEDKKRRNEFGQVGEAAGEDDGVDVDEQLLLEIEKKEKAVKIVNETKKGEKKDSKKTR